MLLMLFLLADHIYERTCPVYKSICQTANLDGSQSAPMHVVIGNAGYELSWFANPDVPPYWDVIYLEHGYQRCTVNSTSFFCEACVPPLTCRSDGSGGPFVDARPACMAISPCISQSLVKDVA